MVPKCLLFHVCEYSTIYVGNIIRLINTNEISRTFTLHCIFIQNSIGTVGSYDGMQMQTALQISRTDR